MKRNIIVGLLLIVTVIIIGGFAIWQHPYVQKELLRQYLGRMIVSGINHYSKPAAAKWGLDMQASNLYPQIIVTMKLRDYNNDTGVSVVQLQQQSCAVLEFFQNLKQSTRTKVYGLLIEDRLSFQIEVFNESNQKIQNASQVLAECPNFPYA
ncbi:hypothetical protein NDN13_09975 [Acinetobacter sp. C32I]|uniref:hypothetical protein n=1 Tax=Acinetobacter sp. C32I TaxID=2950074 RepID=UPI002036FA88|nr:hypothetical protein [Acinetobacter sp. C32I]USA55480.1 hypothetical protein NDN13_09975 [Acinetobacter sp. C32I]